MALSEMLVHEIYPVHRVISEFSSVFFLIRPSVFALQHLCRQRPRAGNTFLRCVFSSEMFPRSLRKTSLDCEVVQRSRQYLYTVQRDKQVTYKFRFSKVERELRSRRDGSRAN